MTSSSKVLQVNATDDLLFARGKCWKIIILFGLLLNTSCKSY